MVPIRVVQVGSQDGDGGGDNLALCAAPECGRLCAVARVLVQRAKLIA